MTPNLIRDITSHILNAPDRTAATGKGIRILAKMHARKDRQMTTAAKTVRVRLLHNASIPSARWCSPIGWEPRNTVEGAEFADGSWWTDDEEAAGLVWFGDRNAYGAEEAIDANIDDIRVASCGDCRVIGTVEL
jgi:hypothetical protein